MLIPVRALGKKIIMLYPFVIAVISMTDHLPLCKLIERNVSQG